LGHLSAKKGKTHMNTAIMLRETNGYFACNRYKYSNLFIYSVKGKLVPLSN